MDQILQATIFQMPRNLARPSSSFTCSALPPFLLPLVPLPICRRRSRVQVCSQLQPRHSHVRSHFCAQKEETQKETKQDH